MGSEARLVARGRGGGWQGGRGTGAFTALGAMASVWPPSLPALLPRTRGGARCSLYCLCAETQSVPISFVSRENVYPICGSGAIGWSAHHVKSPLSLGRQRWNRHTRVSKKAYVCPFLRETESF